MAPSVAKTVEEVGSWPTSKKTEFCDILISELTVMNREIWSNEKRTETQKLDMLKWSNELAHRVWNPKWRLSHGEDEFVKAMLGYVGDYISAQPLLATLLPGTLDSAKCRLLWLNEAD